MRERSGPEPMALSSLPAPTKPWYETPRGEYVLRVVSCLAAIEAQGLALAGHRVNQIAGLLVAAIVAEAAGIVALTVRFAGRARAKL